jgi:hypothetical protein
METLREPGLSSEGREEGVNCLLCRRKAVSELCSYHQEAKENLEAAYPLWVRAYGGIDWENYLDNIKRNPQTGQWVKEAAELLRDH